MTVFNLLHYICYTFHSHCFLVNILLYAVIVSACISCIKWKGRPKQRFKVSAIFLLFHSLLFCLLILILLTLEMKFDKCKTVLVAETFAIFNLCRPIYQICDNRKVRPLPLSFLHYNWLVRNLQTTQNSGMKQWFLLLDPVCLSSDKEEGGENVRVRKQKKVGTFSLSLVWLFIYLCL